MMDGSSLWNSTISCPDHPSFGNRMNDFLEDKKALDLAIPVNILMIIISVFATINYFGKFGDSLTAHVNSFIFFFVAFGQIALFLKIAEVRGFFIDALFYAVDKERTLCPDIPEWVGKNYQKANFFLASMIINLIPFFLIWKALIQFRHRCEFFLSRNRDIGRYNQRNRRFIFSSHHASSEFNSLPSYTESLEVSLLSPPEYEMINVNSNVPNSETRESGGPEENATDNGNLELED